MAVGEMCGRVATATSVWAADSRVVAVANGLDGEAA